MEESHPKMVSQFLLGSILLGLSALLVVPCAVSLVEYKNRAKPLPGAETSDDTDNTANENRMKVYQIIQIVILAFACLGFIFGFYVMETSTSTSTSTSTISPSRIATRTATSMSTRTGGLASRTKAASVPLSAYEIF